MRNGVSIDQAVAELSHTLARYQDGVWSPPYWLSVEEAIADTEAQIENLMSVGE